MSDGLPERRVGRAETYGRDWAGIGVGLVGALSLIAIFIAGIWAVVVLAEASV